MIYATISGQRGKATPVSVVRVSPDGRGTPFVTGILNATGLAFNADGDLFVTSRAEGTVYRVDAAGEFTVYAEGMGVATGAAFDRQGNLFVGDRSGTIFKINTDRKIFVHATLEPSVVAYHLAVNRAGMLFVTGPTLSSNDAIWIIEPNGDTRAWHRGLGRPQGLAIAHDGEHLCRRLPARAPRNRACQRPRAKQASFWPEAILSALPSHRLGRPSLPPTKPFMMWTWAPKGSICSSS